jgi:hypothetical protein
MADLLRLKLVQLDSPGPYTTPTASVFLGVVVSDGQLPVQLQFRLANGSELHLPISEAALHKLTHDLQTLADARETLRVTPEQPPKL